RLNRGRQDALAIRRRLLLEETPGRHRNESRVHIRLSEDRFRRHDERDLRAARDQDDVGILLFFGRVEDVGAAEEQLGGRVDGAIERGYLLAREHERGGATTLLERRLPRPARL